MFKNLFLNRPLAVIDLETTGTDPKTDRIVEIGVVKIFPDGSRDDRCRRVNPGVPIPEAATAIHGITDADVKDKPAFAILVPGLVRFLDGCDLCGFNLKRFDLRVLIAEFDRAGRRFPWQGRKIVDPLEIFHDRERLDPAVRCASIVAGNMKGRTVRLPTRRPPWIFWMPCWTGIPICLVQSMNFMRHFAMNELRTWTVSSS